MSTPSSRSFWILSRVASVTLKLIVTFFVAAALRPEPGLAPPRVLVFCSMLIMLLCCIRSSCIVCLGVGLVPG